MFRWRPPVGGLSAAIADGMGLGTGDRPAPTLPWGEQRDADGRPILPGLGCQDAVVRAALLARLQRDDPAFSRAAVETDARTAFTAILDGWQRLDPDPARRWMTPQLWSGHCARMELLALHDRRPALDGLEVRSVALTAVDLGEQWDRLVMRFLAVSADDEVDGGGRRVRGDGVRFAWRHDWVFQRPVGGRTAVGGAAAQRCPGCGAPLLRDGEGRCTSCRAAVTGCGEAWLVAGGERSDEAEWRTRALLGVDEHHVRDRDGRETLVTVVTALPTVVGGASDARHDPAAVAVLRALDPELDITALATHAAAAVTAWRVALDRMDPAPFQPFADAATAATLSAAIAAAGAAGRRHLAGEPAAATAHVVSAADTEGLVRVAVRVDVELVDAEIAADGSLVTGERGLVHRSCPLELRRHAGTRSGAPGVHRCPRCGAPVGGTVLQACAWCRQAVADGGGDWAVAAIGPLAATTTSTVARGQAAAPGAVAPLPAEAPSLPAGLVAAEVTAEARALFYRVEAALSSLDSGQYRALVTPALAGELDNRVAALRAAGHHRVLSFLDVGDAAVTDAAPDGSRVTVRLDVTGQDWERDDVTGAVVAGAPVQRRWQERWTLARVGPGTPWRVDAVAGPAAADPV